MPPDRLSFSDVLTESFSFFVANIRLFFHLVTIPWIMSVVIRVVGGLAAVDSAIAVLIEKAIDVVPTVMFLVAWQRVVLLGPGRLERLPGLGWSPRVGLAAGLAAAYDDFLAHAAGAGKTIKNTTSEAKT